MSDTEQGMMDSIASDALRLEGLDMDAFRAEVDRDRKAMGLPTLPPRELLHWLLQLGMVEGSKQLQREREFRATLADKRAGVHRPKSATVRLYVAALVEDRDHPYILLAKHRGRGWELPGGKVNEVETWQEAIVREIREEVGEDVANATQEVAPWPTLPIAIHHADFAGHPSMCLVAQAKILIHGREIKAGDDAVDARFFSPDKVPLADLSDIPTREQVLAWIDGRL